MTEIQRFMLPDEMKLASSPCCHRMLLQGQIVGRIIGLTQQRLMPRGLGPYFSG